MDMHMDSSSSRADLCSKFGLQLVVKFEDSDIIKKLEIGELI